MWDFTKLGYLIGEQRLKLGKTPALNCQLELEEETGALAELEELEADLGGALEAILEGADSDLLEGGFTILLGLLEGDFIFFLLELLFNLRVLLDLEVFGIKRLGLDLKLTDLETNFEILMIPWDDEQLMGRENSHAYLG